MNAQNPIVAADDTPICPASAHDPVFGKSAYARFAAAYPETPHIIAHDLAKHKLLSLVSLGSLASKLPEKSIEYNRGNLPIGVDGKPGATGLSIEETILHIASTNSWAVLKNIEQVTEYKALLLTLLSELKPAIEAKTGKMLRPQGFIFISSPNAVTPYHFDPEHNLLMQLTGSKVMTQFPAGDATYAPDEIHEGYHSGGGRELVWRDELAEGGTDFSLSPGEALFVPVMAPHYVRNGPQSAISLSITWRSEWSFAEADARGFNRLMRHTKLHPKAPERWPATNRGKSLAYRCWRKLAGAE